MTIKQILRELKTRQAALGVERDHLRELEDEVAELREVCEDAHDSLTHAIDRLSELS